MYLTLDRGEVLQALIIGCPVCGCDPRDRCTGASAASSGTGCPAFTAAHRGAASLADA